MFGLKSNCELIYAWIGAFAGLFSAFAIEEQAVPAIASAGWLWGGLLLGAGASLFVSFLFRIFYKQRLFALFVSTLFGALLIGLVVLAIASVVTVKFFAMALMFALGAIVGQLIGRALCAACVVDRRSAPANRQ